MGIGKMFIADFVAGEIGDWENILVALIDDADFEGLMINVFLSIFYKNKKSASHVCFKLLAIALTADKTIEIQLKNAHN